MFGDLSVCLALATGFAHAGQPYFVTPAAIDAGDMLPAPQADDSTKNKAEVRQLHQIEDRRTRADIAHARSDTAERDIFIFRIVLGDAFNSKALPLTAALSAHVEEDGFAGRRFATAPQQVLKKTRLFDSYGQAVSR